MAANNRSESDKMAETEALANSAQNAANAAQKDADEKKRVFVSQPVPPYSVGDLWAQGGAGDLMRCKTARATGAFVAGDWELATKYIDADKAGTVAQNKVDAQTQTDIFNKLTDNGALQGLYMKDGELYINASYLSTGVLASKDGNTFHLDLDKGVLKGKFQELSISGKTVDTIAQEKANSAVSAQTQTDIFNKLTNNGALPGLFMLDGQMYINADYMATGILKSKDGTVAINLNDGVVKFFNELVTNGLKVRSTSTGSVNLFEVRATTSDVGTPLCNMYLNTAEGNQIFGVQETVINGVHKGAALGLYDPVSGYRVTLTVNDFASSINFLTSSGSGKAVLYMEGDGTVHLQTDYINGKKVSWKANGDGTFSLIGT